MKVAVRGHGSCVAAVVAAVISLVAFAGVARSDSQSVERVAAVVNDEPIMQSEIDEQLAILVASRRLDPGDSSMVGQARKEILDQLIEERIIIDYATKQGITVTDDQIKPQVDAAIEDAKSRIGSEEKFQEQLKLEGLTLESLREKYMTDIRKEATAQRIIEREIRSKVKLTDTDIDTFYQHNKSQLPIKPTVFDLAHILIIPKPDAAHRAAAKAKADRALARLKAGESWEKVCGELSEDPNSVEKGGDLGEANEGDFDPLFEAAVKALQPGQRSGVVESSAGFHIIELISRDGTKYHVRHILLLAQPSTEDVGRAIERAKAVHADAKAGKDWAMLVRTNSDDPSSKDKEGKIGEVPASQLARNYVEALDSLSVGGISEILQGPTGFHIFKLLGKTEGGEYKYEDIKDQLTKMLTQKKLSEAYEKWVAEIRKKAFIEIKS